MNINVGDTIGIIALSGECDRGKIEQAKSNLETLGYNVKLSKNIFDQNRYLAGSDRGKIEELENFFKDPEIKLILCARGGYGAIRLVNKINYDVIKANPKPFCGFSDVTALLLMIYKKTGIITYHSPMAQSDFALDFSFVGEGQIESRLKQSPSPAGGGGEGVTSFLTSINSDRLEFTPDKILQEGTANGVLWGGNLSTVVSLCGLDFLPDEDFIFFTEDINEPVYKIDKMFQQLINIEKFSKNCKGIVLGEFLGVDNEDWLNEYFEELASRVSIPIIQLKGITHGENKITLPVGAEMEFDDFNNLVIVNVMSQVNS